MDVINSQSAYLIDYISQHLLRFFLIILLLFGAKKIPEVGRSMGRGIREFKKATKEISSEVDLESDKTKPRATPPTDQPSPPDSAGERPAG